MRRILIGIAFMFSAAASASPPTYYMGHHKNKLPDMKKAAALAAKNPDCQSVSTGLYIPPKDQRYPGKAYLITCNAQSYPGGLMDLYISEQQIHAGETPHTIQPVSIAQAKAQCVHAFKARYSQDAAVDISNVSDNHTANRRVDVVISFNGYIGAAYCIVQPNGYTELNLLP